MPLDGGLDLGLEFLAMEKGVEDADTIEIETVGVGGEVLEEIRQSVRGGDAPKVFFPGGNEFADLFIGVEGMAKAGADMAAVDAGDPGGVRIVGSGKAGQCLGENSRGMGIGGRASAFHVLLQTSTKNGKDGEGAVREEEVTQGLKPDDDEFDRMFPLEGAGVADQGEGAAGGEGGVKGVVRLHLAERGFVAGRQAGELVVGTVSDAKDDDAGGKPTGIPPQGVGFSVEAQIHPEVDVGNDRTPDLAVPRLGGTGLFQAGGEVFPRLDGIGRIAGAGAAGGELGGGGGQAFGRRASTAFQSTKLRNSSM